MKISARNQIRGKVKKISPGAVNTEVVVEVAKGVELVSIITKSSAKTLALKKGKTVYAIIKASSIMVGVDH